MFWKMHHRLPVSSTSSLMSWVENFNCSVLDEFKRVSRLQKCAQKWQFSQKVAQLGKIVMLERKNIGPNIRPVGTSGERNSPNGNFPVPLNSTFFRRRHQISPAVVADEAGRPLLCPRFLTQLAARLDFPETAVGNLLQLCEVESYCVIIVTLVFRILFNCLKRLTMEILSSEFNIFLNILWKRHQSQKFLLLIQLFYI